MADTNRLSIQPVWGTNRKLSYGVLDAAESILQNIDELSDVLDQLTEKYDEAQVRYFAQSFEYVGHFGKHRQHSGFFWKFKADEEEKYIEPVLHVLLLRLLCSRVYNVFLSSVDLHNLTSCDT